MHNCPVCGSSRIVRSRTRVGLERVRRKLTSKRPYRCFNCKWRGWMADPAGLSSLHDEADIPPELFARDAEPDNRWKKAGR